MPVQTRSMSKTAASNATKAVVSKEVRPNRIRLITSEEAASLRNKSSYNRRLVAIYMIQDKHIYDPEIGIHNRQDAARLNRGTALAPEGYYWQYGHAGKTYFNDEWYQLRKCKP